jgi:glycosyltransferase involved in cell wall biosynthesis
MMGTIGRHKNQAAAIRVAKKLGMQLILAGKVRDKDYFEELKKDIDGEQIKWIGEIGFAEKLKLYQEAKAFVFPILWEEPFGLVMIEAMACGTPVVAFNHGAISEVLVDSKIGYVIDRDSEDDVISAIKNIDKIKREDCRKWVEEKFTVEKMVGDYEDGLKKVI